MRLTINKVRELPEELKGNMMYMVGKIGDDNLVIYVTNAEGTIIRNTPMRGGLVPRGTTTMDAGPGLYTIDCTQQPSEIYLPEATGSQDIRIYSFIETTSIRPSRLIPMGGAKLNDVSEAMLITRPTSAICIDSSVGGWTVDSLAGAAGAQGPQGPSGLMGPMGCQGMAGPRGPQGRGGRDGINGTTGERGDIGPMGPVGPASVIAGSQGPQGAPGMNADNYEHFGGYIDTNTTAADQIMNNELWPVIYTARAHAGDVIMQLPTAPQPMARIRVVAEPLAGDIFIKTTGNKNLHNEYTNTQSLQLNYGVYQFVYIGNNVWIYS